MLAVELSNSFTSHPTSPLSRNLNELSIKYNRALQKMSENFEEGQAELRVVIEQMVEVDPNGEQKTQKDEVREALVYMENIVYGVVEAKKRIEEALQKYPQYAHIKIGNFYSMNSWLCGDGDGNPNATAETLQMNVDLFRSEIRDIYLKDLQAIQNLAGASKNKALIDNIKKLQKGEYSNPQAFLDELKKIAGEIPEAKEQLEGLVYKVESFGFHYSKIEVRHNAGDLVETIADILLALKKVSAEEKGQLINAAKNKNAQAAATTLLNEKFSTISRDEFANINLEAFSPTGKRVFERMLVVAKAKQQNPDTFDKLIIAECEGEFHALCAFAVLQASGNSIGQEDSLDIVTLSESAEDLLALSENIRALLDNPQYRQHVSQLGRLIYMIAKSDTQRVGGIGAVYAQERVIEMVSQVFLEAQKKYPQDLGHVGLMAFSGGGQAAPRGGGVISEVYNTVLKAVLRGVQWNDEKVIAFSEDLKAALGENPNPETVNAILEKHGIKEHLAQNIINHLSPIFTTQGHQNIIWFGDSKMAEITLKNLFSQAAYANAKLNLHISEPEVLLPTGQINEAAVKAREDREVYFHAAMDDYTQKVFDPRTSGPIDDLLDAGPGKIMHLIVNGSRPGKRPEANKKSRAVDSRAISYDQVLTLAGLNFGNYVGALAGLKAVIKKNGGGEQGLAAAHSMYANDKATRDSMRSMAVSLAMTDFARAWEELIGIKRPSMAEIKELAVSSTNDPVEAKKITLAKLEVEAIEVAKLAHQIIVGNRDLDLENFTPKDLLKEDWKDLAAQMEEREKKIAPLSKILGRLIHDYNATQDDSEKKKLEKSIKLFASNILALSEMPASVTLTHTKHQSQQMDESSRNPSYEELEVVANPDRPTPATTIRKIPNVVLDKDILSKICPFECKGFTPRLAAERLQQETQVGITGK